MSEISVQSKYMLRVNIRTPLKVIFGTKNIIGGVFSLSTQYVSQLLTVLNQKLNKTVILTCRCSMCIENESTCKYSCSHAPYTRFTSVEKASHKHRLYYNRKAKHRSMKVGERVLVLLPTDRNKLLMQWKGPYRIVDKPNKVDYKIDMNGMTRTCHANLLKL